MNKDNKAKIFKIDKTIMQNKNLHKMKTLY